MASDIHNCLVCSSVIFPTGNIHLDKEEALFLIKIILEIPEYTQFIYPVESSLNSLPVCKPCSSTIKQCIQIYTQISAQVHQFWRAQSDILSKLTKETDHHNKYHPSNNWVDQCRNLVKHRNFTTFKYPFVFHGFPKLPTSILNSHQFPDHDLTNNTTGVTAEALVDHNQPLAYHHQSEQNLILGSSLGDPLEVSSPTCIEIGETFQFKQEDINSTKEIEFENEDDDNDDNDQDYDISDPEESSEEEETPSEPDFKWNPITGKFHCLDPTCSKTAALKHLIERHYRYEHFTKNLALKKSYACDWPSCGKIFRKQSNHLFHMDKHRKAPSLKCGKCEKPFYYPRGLRFHQTRNCDMAASSQIRTTSQDSIPIPKLKRFVRNSKTGKYHCHYHLCTQSFLNRYEIRDHAIMHERAKGIPNQDVTRSGYQNVLNFVPQPSPILPISNVGLPIITRITTLGSTNTVQNNDHFNYFEENSLSRSDPLDNLPSSSGSSLRSPFVAESDTLILNGTPDQEFENEDDEQDSDEDYELSEKDEDSEEFNNHPQKSTKKQCYRTSTCTWPNCGKIFTRKENYECHMNQHRGTPSFKCKPCGKLFYWRRCLIDHYKTTSCKQIEEEPCTPPTLNQDDTNKKGFKCTWKGCRKIFARKTNYESHMTVHRGTPTLKCTRCGKLFYWKRALHQHQNSKDCKPSGLGHRDDECMEGFTCTWPGCGIRLSNQTRLRDHMDRHRGTPKQRCEECGQLFYWRADLISHKKKEHKNQVDKAENMQQSHTNSDDRLLSRIPTMSPSDDFRTTRSSSKPRQIIVKIIEESKEKNNESDCKVETQSSEEFEDEDSNPSNSNESIPETNQGHLSRDMDMSELYTEDDFRQDPITARFHCLEPSCTKSSVSKSYINKHYEVEHLRSKEKESFSCDWPGCGKVIGDKQTFKAHMDKHKGTPQFECEECGKAFYWRKGYLKHKGKDHGRKERKRK